ncbi:acyl dehydratase [Brevibacterium paucivorans]|uniref:Acyl dehydratase n=1 Tax=Brevibacterium paucivorans TaxID=170994 RepID=A0ABS2SJ35_9MICO|nr:MaoC family dehydratase [Brevibacterium paucivorans]MBM7816267.1 acyl dehydratase [Brevibacterium paucivorans]
MSEPRVINGVEELESLVGQPVGTGDWFEITQERVSQFADATDDHQWIHIDEERAKEGPFGSTIAHGYLTLSLIAGLSPKIFTITGMKMMINYGLNKVRFPQPVPVGSRVRDVVELAEVNRKSSGVQVVMNHTVEIEGADKPACIAQTVTLMVEA